MTQNCVHSCKGLCTALEVAELRERDAIREYREYAEQCDYPDIKRILESLIAEREKAVKVLQEKREALAVKFDIIDRISESFG